MSAAHAADERHMRRALQLAARGAGRVEPNPMVGCVIVKGGCVIGEGYHRRFGGPHAEIAALRACRASPRGATVYVTLEPCCHHGKTPPCVDALLAARVRRVVAGVRDPHPRVAGGGLAALTAAQVAVTVGVLADAAAELIAPFAKVVQTGRPWTILKWAQSLDGKIATRTGDSKWISDAACRAHAHRVRGRVDAILVGVGTVRTDDPELTCRVGRPRRTALRVVLDAELRTPPRARLVTTARAVPTWVFCRKGVSGRRADVLTRAGVVLRPVAATKAGLSLPAVLKTLARHGVTNLLVEGGGRVLGRFFDGGLADELHIYQAPLLIGGADAPGPLGGRGVARVANAWRLPRDVRPRRLGDGQFIGVRMTDAALLVGLG
jgi:diaminohydroxyphosphoribosylaminopyrimidine deaminase/5-amino-6-(5-phosphoribosylamino)uracil reductase